MSFTLNGHGAAVPEQQLSDGNTPVEPADPAAAGWVFGGWFADAELVDAFDFDAPVTADLTAYAKWTAVVVPVVPAAATPSLELDLGLAVEDVVAGKTATVAGAGLTPDSAYDLVVRSTPTTIAFGSAGTNGTFTNTGIIPAGLEAGAHTVTLSGSAADGSVLTRVAYFTINTSGVVTYLSTEAAETASAPAALASTGFDLAPLGFAALLLLLAGAGMVASRRRSVA